MGIRTNTTVEVTPDHTTLQHQHDRRQARSKEGRQAQGPRRPPQVLRHDRRRHRRAEGQDWLLPPGYPQVRLRQLQGGRRQGRTAPPHGPEGWHQEGIPEDGQGVRQGSWQVQAGQGLEAQEEGCPQEEARRQEGQEARCQEGRQEARCQEAQGSKEASCQEASCQESSQARKESCTKEEGCCQEVNSLILQTLLYLMLDQIRFKGNYYNVNTGVNYLIYKHCCFVLNKNPEKK